MRSTSWRATDREVQPLPIDPLLPEIVASLRERSTLVLAAPPGAGKTTRVPRALLDAGFAQKGQIVVLEPRRLATRMAARRVAEELGDPLGETVGYSVRFEDVSSPRTRIRFVTEGVLGRRLIASPQIEDVAVVVIDEFHERHLQGDLALALVESLRRSTRPDLRVVVMSATLATEPLAAYLGAPVFRAEGRRFDVAVEYLPSPDDRPLGSQIASAVRRCVTEGLDGDILVFLPGAAEIRRAQEACAKIATEAGLLVAPLHGDLSPKDQDAVVRPAARPKVILSTNVAESSVTIEGVVAVIDSGLVRVASHSPWSGLPRLRVEKISRASATQRAGRAGRVRPGRCFRLYTRADYETRPEHEVPEIGRVDLTQVRLDLAALGRGDPPWLEAPPEGHVRAADELLRQLGATDERHAVTETGRAMLRFAAHPRAARVIVEAERRGVAEDGCLAAAVLTEGDPRSSSKARFVAGRSEDRATEASDLVAILDLVREARESRLSPGSLRAAGLDAGVTHAIDRAATQHLRACRQKPVAPPSDPDTAVRFALLAGYPDRVAKRVRGGGRQLALAGGGSAELSEASVVRDAEWMVALDAEERSGTVSGPGAGQAKRGGVVVRTASAIEPDWLMDLYPSFVEERREVTWNAELERAVTRESLAWAGLVLYASEPTLAPSPEATRVLAQAALAAGTSAFAGEGLSAWVERARFAASIDPAIAAPDEEALRAAITRMCEGRCTFAELRTVGLLATLRGGLGARAKDVDRLAPERVSLASGRTTPVQYEVGKVPRIESRLQDFFGMVEGPRIGAGRVPLVLELLAPNGRAVQVTTDLAGFWQRHYPAVRKELMRRYPRHSWPEDPTRPAPRMRR
jgi:ATP-dependent helicase HrpB